jgi:YgiT-type zinc finger domain-containing protein
MRQPHCSLCQVHARQETTTYTQEIAGRVAMVTDVPVLACPQCGEQYFSPETVDRLKRIITGTATAEQKPRTIEVPSTRSRRENAELLTPRVTT